MKQKITMREVFRRYTRSQPNTGLYPLYGNYREEFNFKNIVEASENWLSYTGNEPRAFERIMELFDITAEKGSKEQFNLFTNRVCSICNEMTNPNTAKAIVKSRLKEATGAKQTYLQKILESAAITSQCDRIIENHKMYSKRFNVDHYVLENAFQECRLQDTVYELCKFVDTYRMGVDSKFVCAMEETMFAFFKNGIEVDDKLIYETVCDYFLSNCMNEKDTEHKLIEVMENAAKKSKFIVEQTYLQDILESVEFDSKVSENAILESSMRDRTKDLINKFKALPAKSEVAFKALITNLLVVNKDSNIADGTKNILSIIFYFAIIVGAFSMSFIVGLIAIVATKTINMTAERRYYDQALKKWYSHRDATDKKLKACKDPEKKKKIEEYLKGIDKAIDNMEAHSDNMRGDDEKKSWDKRPDSYSKKDDGFGDFNMNFGEATRYAEDIITIGEAVSSLNWTKDKVNTLLATGVVESLKGEDFSFLTEFAIKYPGMVDCDRLMESLEYVGRASMMNDFSVENVQKSQIMGECLTKLRDSQRTDIIESIQKKELTDEAVYAELSGMIEGAKVIDKCISEMGITSTITLAAHRLAGKVSELSDKEKVMSRTVDASIRMMQRAVERSMTMENREAVIRGDILPPASKIIKIAAVTGIAAFIHPALAVIMLLGKFAMSAKIRIKERQLIINELEVEQKMIKTYIDDAHEKKDYKKERELRLIEKKLDAQYARMKYNSKIAAPDDSHFEKKDED